MEHRWVLLARKEFHTVNGFVGCEMQVGGIRVKIECGGETLEALLLGTGSGARCAKLLCFLDGGFAPGTRDNVICRGIRRAQVHGQHRKLQRRATLQEHYLVVRGDAIQFTQVRFGGLDDSFKLL